jgi:ATP-dependent helicase HrpA
VTLWGLPLVVRRKIRLGRIDPVEARELFLRHALVEGDWPWPIRGNALYDFDRANRELRAELAEVEERMRRRDILSDDESLVAFYDSRLPADIADVRAFERWWKRTRERDPGLLTMTRADLLDEDDELDADAFPAEWRQGEHVLPVRYRFEPGADDDGVTVEIPLALLPRIEDAGFDRLVPGLREELVTALLRTLPKPVRRSVVPAGDWARRLLSDLDPSGPVLDALAAAIRAATHVPVTAADFETHRLPSNLRMSFAIVDGDRRLAIGQDLGALRTRFAERTRATIAKTVAAAAPTPGRDLERRGIRTWDVDELPEVLEARGVRGYPALVDEGSSVAVRVFAIASDARRHHGPAVSRLLALTLPSPAGYVQEHLTPAEKLALAAGPYPSVAALLDDVLLAVVDAVRGDRAPRTGAEFDALRTEVSATLLDASFDAVALVARVLSAARDADRAISATSSMAFLSPLADARSQLEALVHAGFVRAAGIGRLRRIPVYLAGLAHRVGRLADNPGRDRAWQTEVEQATELYREAGGTLPLTADAEPRLAAARWMLEELRLSLFAQHLGTDGPVSVQRIRKALSG